MRKTIDKPLLFVYERTKGSALISYKVLLGIFVLAVTFGVDFSMEERKLILTEVFMILLFSMSLLVGLLLIKIKFRNNSKINDLSTRFATLRTDQERGGRKVASCVISLSIYIWFLMISALAFFLLYAHLASYIFS